jgi:hypothetical protein
MSQSDMVAAGVPRGSPLRVLVALGLVLFAAIATVVVMLALRR